MNRHWRVTTERAQTVITGYGRQKDNLEIHMTYKEQLIVRAEDRKHTRLVEAISGVTREVAEPWESLRRKQ